MGLKKSSKKGRKFLFLILTIAILFYIFGGRFGLISLIKLKREENRLSARLTRLKAEKIIMESSIYRIKNDPDYVEKLAREKLGMIKKGEKIIFIKEK